MKAVWVALAIGLLFAMVFLVYTVSGTASMPVMAGAPGMAMPTNVVETISMHMYDGKVPVVY